MHEWLPIVEKLSERLPELERKILQFGRAFPKKSLPRGLFRDVQSGIDCMNEIAKDLQEIKEQNVKSTRILKYQVERLSRKIHILVHICASRTLAKSENLAFSLEAISTREHWLKDLATKRDKLNSQKAALEAVLQTMNIRQNKEAILTLQKELGDIEKQFELLAGPMRY